MKILFSELKTKLILQIQRVYILGSGASLAAQTVKNLLAMWEN